MCIYYRFECGNCMLTQDYVYVCQLGHRFKKLCQIPRSMRQPPGASAPVCQRCGVSHILETQRPGVSQSQQQPTPPKPRIDLQKTLKKYDEARDGVFARAKEEMARKYASQGSGNADQAGAEETNAFERAWEQLKANIRKV